MEFSTFNGQMMAMVDAAGQLAGEDIFSNEYGTLILLYFTITYHMLRNFLFGITFYCLLLE
jgi:hypothetical protein